MDDNFVKMEDLEWEVIREGVARKVVQAHNGTVVLNRFNPGHKPFPHKHLHEQVSTIIKGQLDFSVDGKIFPMKEGDILVIPSNAVHFATATGNEECLNLDFFAPRRDDYAPTLKKITK